MNDFFPMAIFGVFCNDFFRFSFPAFRLQGLACFRISQPPGLPRVSSGPPAGRAPFTLYRSKFPPLFVSGIIRTFKRHFLLRPDFLFRGGRLRPFF